MSVNTARFEGGTLVTVDQEEVIPAAGWTLGYASVIRTGSLVAVHLEAEFAQNAAGLVGSLGGLYAPGATVTDPSGEFTISAGGQIEYSGSRAAAGSAVCQLIYVAGVVSP